MSNGTTSKKSPGNIRLAPILIEAAGKTADEVVALLNTSAAGLTQAEAEERRAKYGPNQVAQEKQHTWLYRLWTATRNPLAVLLTLLATLVCYMGLTQVIKMWLLRRGWI